jgi:SWI/SNF-related matrix-associated actin-dependent regulator 1 of chromatin subfamily A
VVETYILFLTRIYCQRAALEQLRFRKFKKQRAGPSTFTPDSPSSSVTEYQTTPNAPPLQSRDATLPSRYFRTQSSQILVPNSSPPLFDIGYAAHQSTQCSNNDDVAGIPGLIHSSPLIAPAKQVSVDPLSAPSGFVSHPVNSNTSSSRPWGNGDSRKRDMDNRLERSPPRKRLDHGLGTSPDQLDFLNAPESPVVQRLGQRRRLPNNNVDGHSTSSDESMPDIKDILSGPSKPRIMRGRRPDAREPQYADASHSESEDPKFVRFKITMPQYSPSHVRIAWEQAHGDVKQATSLLSDPDWDPRPPFSSQSSPELTGRVKEVDEATRAQRAATKEKGKKSLIYANRAALEIKQVRPSTPPGSTGQIDLTASSPLQVSTGALRRRPIKMLPPDSSSSDEEPGLTSSRGVSDEDRALEYFKTAKADELQELIGK